MPASTMRSAQSLRGLSGRLAHVSTEQLRARVAQPPQARHFRCSLVVEMGRRAAKIANTKARALPGCAYSLGGWLLSSPVFVCQQISLAPAGQGGHGAREAVREGGQADHCRVRSLADGCLSAVFDEALQRSVKKGGPSEASNAALANVLQMCKLNSSAWCRQSASLPHLTRLSSARPHRPQHQEGYFRGPVGLHGADV